MKIRMGLIYLCACMGLTSWAWGQSQYIKVKQENLRAEPNGKKLAGLNSGAEVQVLETQGQWAKVQVTGWIWKSSLIADPTRVFGYKIRVSHILCKDEALAQAILDRLQKGEDFATLAKNQSADEVSAEAGGDLGTFARGDLLPIFEEAAFKLKVNEISSVVQTTVGFHIIKRTQ